MWYLYLRRDQQYLRSYRTHNLWLDSYHKKMRQPKINALHVAFLRRMAKSVSAVSVLSVSCVCLNLLYKQALITTYVYYRCVLLELSIP